MAPSNVSTTQYGSLIQFAIDDKLDESGTNYNSWMSAMEIALSARQLFDTVTGVDKAPADTATKQLAAWRARDSLAVLVQGTLPNPPRRCRTREMPMPEGKRAFGWDTRTSGDGVTRQRPMTTRVSRPRRVVPTRWLSWGGGPGCAAGQAPVPLAMHLVVPATCITYRVARQTVVSHVVKTCGSISLCCVCCVRETTYRAFGHVCVGHVLRGSLGGR